jgi:hypothetical protein
MNRKEEIAAAREERQIRSLAATQETNFTKKIWSMAGAASVFVLVASLSVGFGVSLATGGLGGSNVASGGGTPTSGTPTDTVNPGPAPAPNGALASKGSQSNPANAITDGFIFTNIGEIVASSPLSGGAQPEPSPDDPSTVDLKIYLDYGCSYCKIFEDVEHRNLQTALATPEVNISYHILSFLGPFSNAAGNASACVASLEPERWDEVHLKLFSLQAQGAQFATDEEAGGYVATALEPLGLAGETMTCINELRHVDWLAGVTGRAFGSPQALDGRPVDGTPTVVADGQMYVGEEFDAVGQINGMLAKHRGLLK